MNSLLIDLGAGGLAGYLCGYGLKKVMKIVAAILGAAFLGLQWLQYQKVISIHYSRFGEMAAGLVHNISSLEASTAPLGVGFAGGFVLGLRQG